MDSGTLTRQGIAEVLRGLGARRETGCLHVARDAQAARIWLDGGSVYTAQAPEARARLGERLVGAGVLAASQLEQALAAQASSSDRRRIGQFLVERGMIDRETLRAYVRDQILDSVTAMLSWQEGEWHFARGEEALEDVRLDMSLENVLVDASRRLEEWEVIRAELGSLDKTVDFVPSRSGAQVALTVDEWSLMTQIDGSANVAEIAEQAGYGQFETARIIYGLVIAGIVQTLEEDAEPPSIDRNSLLAELAALGEPDAPDPRAGPTPDEPAAERQPWPAAEPKPPPPPPPRTPQPPRPQERQGWLRRLRRG